MAALGAPCSRPRCQVPQPRTQQTRPRCQSTRLRSVSVQEVETAVEVKPEAPSITNVAQLGEQQVTCPVLSALRPPPKPNMHPFAAMLTSIISPREAPFKFLADGQPVVEGRFFGFPLNMVGGREAMKEVLAHEAAGRMTVGWPPSTVMLLGSDSVMMQQDPAHHMQLRRLVGPALSASAVALYLPQIQAATRDLLDRLVVMTYFDRPVKVVPILRNHIVQVTTSCALGIALDSEELDAFAHDFEVWMRELFSPLAIDKWPYPFHEAMEARRRLAARMQAKIYAVRADIEMTSRSAAFGAMAVGEGVLHRRSVLWRLLSEKDEDGNSLTDQQVIDNILGLTQGGRDTTSTLLTYLLYDMAEHPQVLVRLREEQQRVVAAHGPNITAAALEDMPYAHAVMIESLRRRIIVGGGMRVTNEDVSVAGCALPKGALTLLQYGHLSTTDPRWPAEGDPADNPLHPANYNPDRFMTPEGSRQGNQFHFGMGERTCLGQFMAQAIAKTMLALLARDYDYLADTCGKWTTASLLLTPVDDLPVIVTKRGPPPPAPTYA